MDYNTYDRYAKFREDGVVQIPPYVDIPVRSTDVYITYQRGYTRMDVVSYDYYGDPNYGWLIMYANASLGMNEFQIADGSTIRIPYPLDSALTLYKKAIDEYQSENGTD